jgi:hypothetical protein
MIGKGSDPFGLGRWSYITLRGKDNKKLTIVTGYRVCQATPSSAGIKTAYMQQYRKISAKLRDTDKQSTPNPRHQFVLDLQAWLENLIKEGHHIILSIDSNEELNPTEGKITNLTYNQSLVTANPNHDGSLSTLVNTCGLIDILQTHHSEKALATYNRGITRLDYILISNNLGPATLRSGILPFSSVFLSDNRPCYIDLDASSVFQELTSLLAPADRRGLQLTDPRIVQKYQDIVKTQLNYHNLVDKKNMLQVKADQSIWSPEDTAEYEKIEKLHSEIRIHAERSISRNYSKNMIGHPH